MSCKKVATVIGSVLLLAFATVTAWANDRIVSTVTITPGIRRRSFPSRAQSPGRPMKAAPTRHFLKAPNGAPVL